MLLIRDGFIGKRFSKISYLACCWDDMEKDDFCWDSVEDWAMALDIIAALLATIVLPDSNPCSIWVDMIFPSCVLADDNLDSFSVERDLRRWSWWYSTACWADISADDNFVCDETFFMLAVVETAVEEDLAATYAPPWGVCDETQVRWLPMGRTSWAYVVS